MNIKDIPRTIDAVRNLPINVRYRIAMQVGAIPTDKDSIAAFADRPLDEQAAAILNKLLEIDASGGQVPQAPPPAAPVVRNPDPIPQQVGAPTQLGATAVGYAPPQQLGQAVPQQLGGQVIQMPQQPTQQPIRTPVTAQDPGTPGPSNGASQAALAANGLAALSSKLDRLIKTVDEVPNTGNTDEIQEAVMGIATSVNTLVIIGLLILERVHDDMMPRNLIYDMIREQMAARTSEQLMGALKGPSQGK